MDKELFKETENKICRYFAKDKLTKSLNAKLKLLESQIALIQNNLQNCNISIEPNIKAISYEERVQTSGDGTSYAEREAIRITEYKIKRMTEKQMEKERTLEQLDQIELDYNFIKDAIEPIKGLFKELLELKYKKYLGEEKIGEILHLTQPQINKKKGRLVKKIAD